MNQDTHENPTGLIKGKLAIIGRPNVGKSTLFNRLTRSKTSIVDDTPGVTRDRIYGQVFYDSSKQNGFYLIDTGGFESKDFTFQPFADNLVWKQTQAAAVESDAILLVFDGKAGLNQHDKELYEFCKRLEKPLLVAVNKIDGHEKEDLIWEFYQLGIKDCLPVSAAHSKGLHTLLEAIQDVLAHAHSRQQKVCMHAATKIALIGRPNAGKSSILNRLVGTDRSLVSDVAGTTRDSTDTPFVTNGQHYVLIDTAGIRRKPKIKEHLEIQSVSRSIYAIDRADVVVVVIDANAGITDQDARLINLSLDRHKPLLIAVNKWDLVPDKQSNTTRDYQRNIHQIHLKNHDYVPVHFMSCLTNQRVHELMAKVEGLVQQSKVKISTARLNECLQKAVNDHSPRIVRKYTKRVKFYYATQVRTKPPTIVIMCNVSDEIQESYKRYLQRRIRAALGIANIPIRFIYRGKKEAQDRRKEKLLSQGLLYNHGVVAAPKTTGIKRSSIRSHR